MAVEPPELALSFAPLPSNVVGPRAPLGRIAAFVGFMRNPALAQLRWAKAFPGAGVVAPVAGDVRIAVAYGPAALRDLSVHQGENSDWIRPEAGGIKLVPGTIPHVAIRGISTTNGAEHAARRRPAMAVTHGRERLEPVERTYAENARSIVAALGEYADARTFCSEFSSRNSVSVVFGLRDEALVRSRLKDVDAFMDGITSPFTMMLQKDWAFTPYRRWLRVTERLYHWAASVIEQKQTRDPEQTSILGALAHAPDETGSKPTTRRLIGDAVNLYIVGHGSTWQQIAWALLLIAAHPRVQGDLRDELRATLAGRGPRSDDALPLLDACLNESLRLLPATHALNPRMARREVQVPGRDGATTTVPAGAMVFGAQLQAHHDPELWRDPKRFEPARWLGGFKPDPYAFLPFGQGPRRCVGDAIAWSQLRTLVAAVMQQSFVTLPRGARYDYKANPVQLMPGKQVPLRFVRELPRDPVTLEGPLRTDLLS